MRERDGVGRARRQAGPGGQRGKEGRRAGGERQVGPAAQEGRARSEPGCGAGVLGWQRKRAWAAEALGRSGSGDWAAGSERAVAGKGEGGVGRCWVDLGRVLGFGWFSFSKTSFLLFLIQTSLN